MGNKINILSAELDPEGFGLMRIEHDGSVIQVLYYVDDKDEWHFFYENGNKPDDPDFEYKVMCNL